MTDQASFSGCHSKAQDYIDTARDYWEATFDKLDPSVIHERFGG